MKRFDLWERQFKLRIFYSVRSPADSGAHYCPEFGLWISASCGQFSSHRRIHCRVSPWLHPSNPPSVRIPEQQVHSCRLRRQTQAQAQMLPIHLVDRGIACLNSWVNRYISLNVNTCWRNNWRIWIIWITSELTFLFVTPKHADMHSAWWSYSVARRLRGIFLCRSNIRNRTLFYPSNHALPVDEDEGKRRQKPKPETNTKHKRFWRAIGNLIWPIH